MSDLLFDFRVALRALRRTPGFTALAVLLLGLGLGINVTVFTLADGLLRRPPAGMHEPERLVRINRTVEDSRSGSLSYPDYRFYRDQSKTLRGVAAYGSGTGVVLARTGTEAIEARAALISANFFDVLGVGFTAGRGFLPDDDRAPGGEPVAVVSYRFWQAHLGGSPQAVGSQLTINGHPTTIVGVLDGAFRGVGPAESDASVWLPITMQPLIQPSETDLFRRVPGQIEVWIRVIGRLAPDAGIDHARAEFTMLAGRLEEEFPFWNEGSGVHVTEHFALQPELRDRIVSLLRLLAAASGTVLLIVCANLALLLLARASARQREFGVRAALGAGRRQVVSRFLAESVVLAVLGSVLGVVTAVWVSGIAAALLPFELHADLGPAPSVLGFAIGLGLVTAVVVASVPAWAQARGDATTILRDGSRTTARAGLRDALVAVQVALSLVLVAGAGLFVKSLSRADQVELGFGTEQRLLATLNLQDHGYTAERGQVFVRAALERLASIPTVRSVTTTRMIALGGGMWTTEFGAIGATAAQGSLFQAGTNWVGPGYFETMEIPLVEGRGFLSSDDESGAPVVVVNEALARSLWGDGSPLGRVITRGTMRHTVVGLARDAAYYELGEAPQDQLYFSHLQHYGTPITFVVRSEGDAASLASAVREAFGALDPNLAVSALRTYDDVIGSVLASYRNVAALVGVLGLLALVLAVAGLYGVLSFLVAQRQRDIAVRMALGAKAGAVAGRVVGRGLALTTAGIGLGAVAFLLFGGLVRALLFRVDPADPQTILVTSAALLTAAAAACYVPARRAARVNPMEALRHE